MTNSDNDVSQKKQNSDKNIYVESDRNLDKIDLIDYFVVLWKRKWFILLSCVLPIFVSIMFFVPAKSYTLAFMYNTQVGEKDLMMFEDLFYSEENIQKLAQKLRGAGFEEYEQKLASAGTRDGLKNILAFEVSPSFEALSKIQKEKSSLLTVKITLNSEKDIRKAALIFRENVEKVIPLYSEKEYLSQNIIDFKSKMAVIEETRYLSNMELERKKSKLEKLNTISSNSLDKLPGDNIVLQFSDVKNSSVYLPLSYQRQAAETQIINAEELVRADNELYNYYEGLLKLNEGLFKDMNKVIASDGTLVQFCLLLNNTLAEYKDDTKTVDYLKAYVKNIEIKMSNNMPITEKPKVYVVARDTKKKASVVFAIALILSVFTAFLLEGLENRKMKVA